MASVQNTATSTQQSVGNNPEQSVSADSAQPSAAIDPEQLVSAHGNQQAAGYHPGQSMPSHILLLSNAPPPAPKNFHGRDEANPSSDSWFWWHGQNLSSSSYTAPSQDSAEI
ncbi:hypothetical protein PLICRDRAFT_700871 [Plicaturopsis crispa FD-325 SS-3]|nr:hypothetical protein PLICRDRAFT_700871 [Plicaturopsis crispa FD-325 SS-3]